MSAASRRAGAPRMTDPKPSDHEIEQHERFIRESLQGFVELPGAFDALDSHIADASPELCAVTAGTGMGKSTLLAAWADCFEPTARSDGGRARRDRSLDRHWEPVEVRRQR